MTREEGKEFANALKNNYTIDFDKIPDFCDLVISTLEKNESAEEWYKLLCEKWEEGELVYGFPKGATNGEVIKALFPNIELVEIYNSKHRFFLKGREMEIFDLKAHVDWWNAPYKAESEDKE